jgi:D-glycero-D-manno-heptose 1,7-bisphosphate phosphatase
MSRAVFLDRDGVLNNSIQIDGKPYPPKNLEELAILPGVLNALIKIKKYDLKTIVITNQPDIARGKTSVSAVEEINSYLMECLPLDAFYMCPHDDSVFCNCRKPKPGLILTAAKDFGINLESSFVVGDRWRDIAAGQSVGCKCFFVDYGYDDVRPLPPYQCVSSLWEAATEIVREIED